MGTLIADIGTGAGIVVAAAEINGQLNTARTCTLVFGNNTPHTLRLADHKHAHGGFMITPSFEIPSRHTDLFGSQSKAFSFGTGTEGSVKYDITGLNTTTTIRWNNPFVGSNTCSGRIDGERAAAFEIERVCGAGNDAQMRYELRQVHEPRLIRAPDYRWVRLEGYAYDPEHNWWPEGPDDPPTFPTDHEVAELHSWWSPGRGDNWTTTDPRHTKPIRDPISPDYRHYRPEGYILAPDVTSPEGAVPLHSWWSPGRGDNWTTTDPRHTTPLRERISPDYRHYRHEGWLFSPRLPQPDHTIPVHSWYSPSRGDNFITTDSRYRP